MAVRDQAEQGLVLIQQAILQYLASQPNGVTSATISRELGLESDFEGNQKNYLAWSVLGLLVNAEKVRYETVGRSKLYFVV